MERTRTFQLIRKASAALLVSGFVLAATFAPVTAAQIPDDNPSNGRLLTFPSGLTVTMVETGANSATPAEMLAANWIPMWDGGMRQSGYVNALGDFSPSPYSVNGLENANQVSWYSLTYFGDLYGFPRRLDPCPITATRAVEMRCARDSVSFTFSHPVTDPVLHINNFGANSYSNNNEWTDQRLLVHSSSMLTLDLANSSYTGTPDLTMLNSVGDIAIVRDGASQLLDPSDSRLDGAPAIARASSAVKGVAQYIPGGFGAGSVKVKGTWTTITFNRDLHWQYDTYNAQNRPDLTSAQLQHQANNECVLDQLPANVIYFCSLNGATWQPDVTKPSRSWDNVLAATAVKNAIQLENPAPEGVSYLITVDEDFGTAPATYDESNGASHVVGNARIGASVSAFGAEVGSAPNGVNNSGVSGIVSPNAGGTDSDDNAFTKNPNIDPTTSYTATIPVSGITSPAKLCGWIDADASGTFSSTERQCVDVAPGATSAALTWPSTFTSTVKGASWMRLRLSYDLNGVMNPTGRLDSGEVEDWAVTAGVPTTTSQPVQQKSLPQTGGNFVPSLVALLLLGLGVISRAVSRRFE